MTHAIRGSVHHAMPQHRYSININAIIPIISYHSLLSCILLIPQVWQLLLDWLLCDNVQCQPQVSSSHKLMLLSLVEGRRQNWEENKLPNHCAILIGRCWRSSKMMYTSTIVWLHVIFVFLAKYYFRGSRVQIFRSEFTPLQMKKME